MDTEKPAEIEITVSITLASKTMRVCENAQRKRQEFENCPVKEKHVIFSTEKPSVFYVPNRFEECRKSPWCEMAIDRQIFKTHM